jgi:hypothetical protein
MWVVPPKLIKDTLNHQVRMREIIRLLRFYFLISVIEKWFKHIKPRNNENANDIKPIVILNVKSFSFSFLIIKFT